MMSFISINSTTASPNTAELPPPAASCGLSVCTALKSAVIIAAATAWTDKTVVVKLSWNVIVQRRCCRTSRRCWVTRRTMKLRRKSRQRCSHCATWSRASTKRRSRLAKTDVSSSSFALVLGIECSCYTPFTRYNRLYDRFDNRLYLVNKRPTGCQTRLTTGWMFVYTIQPVDNRFDNHVEQTATVRSTGCHIGLYNRFDNRLNVCIHNTTGCQTSLTTGCIM